MNSHAIFVSKEKKSFVCNFNFQHRLFHIFMKAKQVFSCLNLNYTFHCGLKFCVMDLKQVNPWIWNRLIRGVETGLSVDFVGVLEHQFWFFVSHIFQS